MRRVFSAILLRGVLIFVIGAALASVSYAHRITLPDTDMAAFLELGGTLDDLCGTAGETAVDPASCEACRITDAMSAGPGAQIAQFAGPSAAWSLILASQRYDRARDPAHPGRAPPFV